VWARHRDITAGDVFIASYPRSGSTWLRFVLAEVLTGEPATFPLVNRVIPQVGYHSEALRLPDGGRFIKTHESYRPECRKAIYLVRDPRDVLLSEYAYQQALGLVHCDLNEYIGHFLGGAVNGNGAWQRHVESWLDAAMGNPEILVVKFEDLRHNTVSKVAQLLDFLSAPAEPDAIRRAIENNTTEKMRSKELDSPQRSSQRGQFIRAGAVGGWRQRLSATQLQRIEHEAAGALRRAGYEPAPKVLAAQAG
jgi:Sulfotransferase domain